MIGGSETLCGSSRRQEGANDFVAEFGPGVGEQDLWPLNLREEVVAEEGAYFVGGAVLHGPCPHESGEQVDGDESLGGGAGVGELDGVDGDDVEWASSVDEAE